ncbi:winged helix-turn-helix transcriptional regulator [Amycolatopsis sp. NPDC051903]|uniref:winged helix-turn-helix transcriptional regulator n=1 Tax=Amycolatopsis sp. NPDC051903 TaxID=3363936 RepID=UPI0037A44517
MRTPRIADPRVCSIDAAVRVVGEKWALLAVRELMLGATRFDEIVAATGAPRDRLAARLRALEETGIVRREQYQERPARHSYHLTEAGEQLYAIVHLMRDWGDRFVRDDPEHVVVFRHECGKPWQPEVRCAGCDELVEPGSLTAERDVRVSDLA